MEYALGVMREYGLHYAELQYMWDKEVGDLDDAQMGRLQRLFAQHAVEVCCISRHIFAGLLVGATEVGDEAHRSQMTALRRCIDMAKGLQCGLVRIMSFRKEMILFGSGGAEIWNVTKGAWDKLKLLLEPAVKLAEDQGITLVVETGNNGIINSGYLARKLIDELGSKHLTALWDPANSLYSNEPAYPDGYELLRGGYLGHIHMKDCRADIPKATVDQCRLGMVRWQGFSRTLRERSRAMSIMESWRWRACTAPKVRRSRTASGNLSTSSSAFSGEALRSS